MRGIVPGTSTAEEQIHRDIDNLYLPAAQNFLRQKSSEASRLENTLPPSLPAVARSCL